jgi:hypothetical protein
MGHGATILALSRQSGWGVHPREDRGRRNRLCGTGSVRLMQGLLFLQTDACRSLPGPSGSLSMLPDGVKLGQYL